MGAVLIGDNVNEIKAGTHGSTFGGNPVGCAAGLAVIDILENSSLIEDAYERGKEIREFFQKELSEDIVREVRGRGYMFGIELRTKITDVLPTLQEKGVVALPAGVTVLRLLPPLVISKEDIWQVAETVVEVVNAQQV